MTDAISRETRKGRTVSTQRPTGLVEVWSAREGEGRDRQRVLDLLRMHAAVTGRASLTAREVADGLGMEGSRVVPCLKALIAMELVVFMPGSWVREEYVVRVAAAAPPAREGPAGPAGTVAASAPRHPDGSRDVT